MKRFILRRLLATVAATLLAVTIISFGVMQLAPGDYLDTSARSTDDSNPKPSPSCARILVWISRSTCNTGAGCGTRCRAISAIRSPTKSRRPSLIKQRLYYTFILSVWATILAWVVAIPLGVYIARHRNGFADRFANFIAFAGISLPGFFVAHCWR